MTFKSAGLFGRYHDTAVDETIASLQNFLEQHGLKVYLGDTTAEGISGIRVTESGRSLPETIDVGIVIGGDGTMLHVTRALAEFDLPVIGINLGRLGFLTDIPIDKMEEKIDEILRGEYIIEERTMLSAKIFHQDGILVDCTALNDIVLTKGDTGKMIEFEAKVNGESVGRTRGDGVIIATPTGSTAYALSAGGPILHPLLPAVVFAPMCPHTLGQRPLILDDQSQIEIELVDLAGAAANFFVDGLRALSLSGNENILIQRATKVGRMVRVKNHNHYVALSSKLSWG